MNSRVLLLVTSLAVATGFSGLARAEEVVVCGESNGGLISTFYIDLTEGTVRTAIAGVEWGKGVEKMRTFRAKVDDDRIEWHQLAPSYYSLDRHSLVLDRFGALENELSRNCRIAQRHREDRSDVAIPHTVTLYEDDRYTDLNAGSLIENFESLPADPRVRRSFGSVVWRTENVTPLPGAPPEPAIRAELEVTTRAQVQVPERKLAMSLSIRRNTDDALPVSHTVETMFKLPSGSGGVSDVPGVVMRDGEATPGAALAGLGVKVTTGFFLMGLSADAAQKARNIRLLKERDWLDILVVYDNHRRAIFSLQKGPPGARVFSEAFQAWKQ